MLKCSQVCRYEAIFRIPRMLVIFLHPSRHIYSERLWCMVLSSQFQQSNGGSRISFKLENLCAPSPPPNYSIVQRSQTLVTMKHEDTGEMRCSSPEFGEQEVFQRALIRSFLQNLFCPHCNHLQSSKPGRATSTRAVSSFMVDGSSGQRVRQGGRSSLQPVCALQKPRRQMSLDPKQFWNCNNHT